MILLFALILLVALALAAPRYGVDSREGFRTLEHQ